MATIQPKKIAFVINPISGPNRNPVKLMNRIARTFGNKGIDYVILHTEQRGDGTRLAREAIAAGAEIVVAVGGDGTINEVGRGLIGTTAALGVVPAGSGNGFARNFKIPLHQPTAIEKLLNPRIVQIDAGTINGHYFFNVAGVALDAIISASFEAYGRRGALPYFIISVREYFRYQPESFQLRFNRHVLERSPILLSIANAPQYGNGAIIAPTARADDGLLDLCILSPMPLFRTLWNLPRLFNGTIQNLDAMEIIRVRHIHIQRERVGYIHTDGDPHLEGKELDIHVLPAKLRLALPSD